MPSIPLSQFEEMIERYEANKIAILKSDVNPDVLAYWEAFDKSEIEAILNQSNCAAFRIYYGMSEDLNVHAILVGVDASGNDILALGTSKIVEEGRRCPPSC